MSNYMRRLSFLALISLGMTSYAQADYALFDQTTDTIRVDGQTIIGTASTYEAVVIFTTEFNGNGSLFNEWQAASEDKALYVGPTSNGGYNYPIRAVHVWVGHSPQD